MPAAHLIHSLHSKEGSVTTHAAFASPISLSISNTNSYYFYTQAHLFNRCIFSGSNSFGSSMLFFFFFFQFRTDNLFVGAKPFERELSMTNLISTDISTVRLKAQRSSCEEKAHLVIAATPTNSLCNVHQHNP